VCPASNLDALNVGIVATASYIPAPRVRVAPSSEYAITTPTFPHDDREALMQSVYADTIRWRQIDCSAEPTNIHELTALPYERDSRTVAVEPDLMLSDMALHAARMLFSTANCKTTTEKITQIIVCQSSFEHELTRSCAIHLHHELAQGNAPLAIGQLQGASFLMALQVAVALITTEVQSHTILIVAAERWRAPFSRRLGMLTALGDGAAAILVQRDVKTGWMVRGVSVRTPMGSRPAGSPIWIDTATLVSVVRETCEQAQVEPGAIDWVLPALLNPALAHDITVQCGLLPERIVLDDANGAGYLCSADTPTRLDRLRRVLRPRWGQYILTWSVGFQGQCACALLQFRGDEHVRI
jgi:3-oxoacyl-[acyl-carrier-protein] synthase-3